MKILQGVQVADFGSDHMTAIPSQPPSLFAQRQEISINDSQRCYSESTHLTQNDVRNRRSCPPSPPPPCKKFTAPSVVLCCPPLFECNSPTDRRRQCQCQSLSFLHNAQMQSIYRYHTRVSNMVPHHGSRHDGRNRNLGTACTLS